MKRIVYVLLCTACTLFFGIRSAQKDEIHFLNRYSAACNVIKSKTFLPTNAGNRLYRNMAPLPAGV